MVMCRTNFDHRYCFLEDAYDITSTLREVGAVEVMQSYLRFISNIVACYGTEGAFDDEINWQGEEAVSQRFIFRILMVEVWKTWSCIRNCSRIEVV